MAKTYGVAVNIDTTEAKRSIKELSDILKHKKLELINVKALKEAEALQKKLTKDVETVSGKFRQDMLKSAALWKTGSDQYMKAFQERTEHPLQKMLQPFKDITRELELAVESKENQFAFLKHLKLNTEGILQNTLPLIGIGIGVAGIAAMLHEASPVLQGSLKLLTAAIHLYIRPLADTIGWLFGRLRCK